MDRQTKILLGAGAAVAVATALVLNPMGPSSPASPRDRILAEIKKWIPSQMGDGRFEQLLGAPVGEGKWAYYQRGFGTTCAVVAAALLEFARCNPELINRGPSFKIGAHITKMVAGAQKIGAWRAGSLDGIQPGDIYLIATPPAGTDGHVGFFLARDGEWITTADAGQRNESGEQAARIVRRRLRDNALSGPEGMAPYRPIQGYIDIDTACVAGKAVA